jgi:FkbM family methyltransferase
MMFYINNLKKLLYKYFPNKIFILAKYKWQLYRRFFNKIYFLINYPDTIVVYPNSDSSGQYNQPEIIDYLLGSKTGGYFIDIGANHPQNNSNTDFFEIQRKYSGMAFDPLQKYASLWAENRPRTVFKNVALGASAGNTTFIEFPNTDGWQDQLSFTSDSLLYDSAHMTGKPVKVERLDHISDIPSDIDFLSLDVEGAELSVLQGLGGVVRPRIMLVENCFGMAGNREIRDFMIGIGYKFVFRISYIDDLYVRIDQHEIMDNVSTLPRDLVHLVSKSWV